ncbi:hypothetical protein OIU77_018801 [Salix suchowensis]|uniref:DUF868 family protein n=1 Tax=Salix suchowensis TaxID=1278906 RepID=A0ABQ9CFV0_9ROSI|nr:hypothetical protein OIU77_018801 [Salix suchowensis]
MSFQHPLRNSSVGVSLPSAPPEKIADDPWANKTPQSTVTCSYHAYVAGYWRAVTVFWCKNLMNHTLNLIINNLEGEACYNCKIDLKPWLFWSKKGGKSFELEGCQVDINWDFRSAKFSGSPEPASDYYVAIVSDEEVVLLLGDYKKKAYKRTKARPALVEAILYLKKENVFHRKTFSTRAKFDERKNEHDIIVESSTGGPRDPEMWISIDGIVVIHVMNLQWKFRGNQTVMLSRQPVQGFPEPEDDKDSSSYGGQSDTSDGSMYFSTRSVSASAEFCLFPVCLEDRVRFVVFYGNGQVYHTQAFLWPELSLPVENITCKVSYRLYPWSEPFMDVCQIHYISSAILYIDLE